MTDPCGADRQRIRLYLGGKVAEEVWAYSPQEAEDLAWRHRARTGAAETEGVPWLVEIYCPVCPADEAYFRFGTDEAGMGDPRR